MTGHQHCQAVISGRGQNIDSQRDNHHHSLQHTASHQVQQHSCCHYAAHQLEADFGSCGGPGALGRCVGAEGVPHAQDAGGFVSPHSRSMSFTRHVLANVWLLWGPVTVTCNPLWPNECILQGLLQPETKYRLCTACIACALPLYCCSLHVTFTPVTASRQASISGQITSNIYVYCLCTICTACVLPLYCLCNAGHVYPNRGLNTSKCLWHDEY